MRAYEKTVLTFGIVQIPVALYKASAEKGVHLRSLCECGSVPKMSVNCDCGQSYSSWAKVPNRGYEVSKGEFVSFTNEEVKAAKSVESSGFGEFQAVNFTQLAAEYILDSPYHVLPSNEDEATLKGFALLRQALLESGLALVARFNSHKRAKNVALVASKNKKALFLYSLVEQRNEPFTPDDGDPSEHEASLMGQLIKQNFVEKFELEPIADPVLEMVEKKLAGEDYTPTKSGSKKAGASLEELLKASVEMAQ